MFSSLTAWAGETDIEGAVSRPDVEAIEKLVQENTIIGFSWIDMPLNKILLIKNGNNRCAIKYLSASRGGDRKENTPFRSGAESFHGVAELLELPSHEAKKLNLRILPSRGIGRWILYSPSRNDFRCGRGKLYWGYPSATTIWSDDKGTSLAATSLEEFEQVNFEDPNLRWFEYEEGRKMILQPNPSSQMK
jgi:hypothetical protein